MDLDEERLDAWVRSAHTIYAADSGADRLIVTGHHPIVVGDFDSFTMKDQSDGLRLVQDLSEDTTDCDKLLNLVQQDGHRALTLTCVEGDLPDHVQATLSSIVSSSLAVRIAYRRGLAHVVRPASTVCVKARPGQRVSLIPLTACSGVSLSGTRWPLESADLFPGGLVSVSNEADSDLVSASLATGCAMLFVETAEIYWP